MAKLRIKTLTQVRKEMLTGAPCNIVVCSYDAKRQTGGDREVYKGCRMLVATEKVSEQKPDLTQKLTTEKGGRNPQHWTNGTFNIVLQMQSQVRKIRWLLIEEFNGYQVVM